MNQTKRRRNLADLVTLNPNLDRDHAALQMMKAIENRKKKQLVTVRFDEKTCISATEDKIDGIVKSLKARKR